MFWLFKKKKKFPKTGNSFILSTSKLYVFLFETARKYPKRNEQIFV